MSIGNSQLSPCQEEKEPKREPSFTCTVRGHAAADSRRTNGRRAESGRGEGKGREGREQVEKRLLETFSSKKTGLRTLLLYVSVRLESG